MTRQNQSKTKTVVAAPAVLSPGWALFLVFLVLKLTEVISWSWIWIFAPLWIPFLLFLLLGFVALTLAVVKEIRR